MPDFSVAQRWYITVMQADKIETRRVTISCCEDVLEQSSSYFLVHVGWLTQAMHTNLVIYVKHKWVIKYVQLYCDVYSGVEGARKEFQYIFSAGMYPTS